MQDKHKVAKVIADMLGVSSYRTPEQAINNGLKASKNSLSKDLIPTLRKMLDLASEVGIAYDKTLVPKGLHEGAIEVETGSVMSGHVDVMQPAPVMKYKEYVKKKTAPHMDNHEDDPHTKIGNSLDQRTEDDQLRRRKVDYKINEQSEDLEEDLASADYKVSKSGHKYRAHHITFKNSRAGAKLADDPDEEEDENIVIKEEDEVDDISDDDLEDMADEIDDEEDVLDAYDDDELTIIDSETGEELDDEEELDESVLNEVLSKAERMRARIRFMKYKSRRQRKLQIALKKRSDTKTLMRRARKLAIKLLKKRLMKKDAKDMTVAEKERAEGLIHQRKKAVDRLAMRLLPKVRKIESDRLSRKANK